MTLSDSPFFEKVKLGVKRHGLLVDFIPLDKQTMHMLVGVPGGPRRGVTLFECQDHSALSTGGSPLGSSDVVQVLRNTVLRRDGRVSHSRPHDRS